MLLHAALAAIWTCPQSGRNNDDFHRSMPLFPRRLSLLAVLPVVLAACISGGPPGPQATPLQAPGGGGNEVRVMVSRAGAAARLGHNHVLRAADLRVEWQPAGPVLRLRLDALEVDPPALRARLGPAFSTVVDDAARQGTRANLLKALDAATHPEVVVRTLRQVGEGPLRAVEGEIDLHGQTHRQWWVAEVQGRRARGQVVVRQSDFGIQPFTVLGGLLAVEDALVVEFEVESP